MAGEDLTWDQLLVSFLTPRGCRRGLSLAFFGSLLSLWLLLSLVQLQQRIPDTPLDVTESRVARVTAREFTAPVAASYDDVSRRGPRSLLPSSKGNFDNPRVGHESSGRPRFKSDRGDLTILKSEEFLKTEQLFEKRRKRYEEGCSNFSSTDSNDYGLFSWFTPNPLGSPRRVYYYKPNGLAVCEVHKVGCTFWKQVFHFLYGDYDNQTNVTSPLHISRYYVHFGEGEKTKYTKYTHQKTLLDTYSKVMFSRDPWARLWSVYIDKFVLPDSWLDLGRDIVRRRADKSKQKRCPDDISFTEFLDYALHERMDAHWKPVHNLCSPCVFHPQYVGKMETFTRDTKHILKAVGLERLMEGNGDHNHAESEVHMLTEYIFRVYENRPGLRECLNYSGLAERLWKAFVLNGYIEESLIFPKKEFTMALDSFSDARHAGKKAAGLLVNYHRLNAKQMTSDKRREFRRSVMAHQYRMVPIELKERVVSTYQRDFTLFDYEARPKDFFHADESTKTKLQNMGQENVQTDPGNVTKLNEREEISFLKKGPQTRPLPINQDSVQTDLRNYTKVKEREDSLQNNSKNYIRVQEHVDSVQTGRNRDTIIKEGQDRVLTVHKSDIRVQERQESAKTGRNSDIRIKEGQDSVLTVHKSDIRIQERQDSAQTGRNSDNRIQEGQDSVLTVHKSDVGVKDRQDSAHTGRNSDMRIK